MKKFFTKISDFIEYLWSKHFYRVVFIIFIICDIFFILFSSPRICEWYVKTIYPFVINSYGRFTSVLPFSFMEFSYALWIIVGITFVVSLIVLIWKKAKPKYRNYMKILTRVVVGLFTLNLCLDAMTFRPLNGCSRITLKTEKRQYTIEEVKTLRDYIYSNIQDLSEQIQRTEDGAPLYDKDVKKEAQIALRNISDEFPKLSGYYPDAKVLATSRFYTFSQIMGITDFTLMSVNYNKDLNITSIPATLTHEYSHIKGFVKEDEANFIAYLSCVKSDDIFFRYSGFLSVMYYVNYDLYISDKENYSEYALDDVCYKDANAFNDEAYEALEKNEEISNVVGNISSTVTDTNIKINGDSSGIASYSYVVALLLQYYDGILY